MAEKSLGFGQFAAHQPAEGITFEYVGQRSQADFVIPSDLEPYSDRELGEEFFEPWLREKYWFLDHAYEGKTPAEQWHIRAGNLTLNVYNYLSWRQTSAGEIDALGWGVARFQAHFPLRPSKAPKDVAILDRFRPYPTCKRSWPASAAAYEKSHLIELATHKGAFSSAPYDAKAGINIETRRMILVHELAHFTLDSLLEDEWRNAGFSWSPVLTPVTQKHAVKDGVKLYTANQPEDCVSKYAQTSLVEDIAESVTSYLGQAKSQLHSRKRRILRAHDRMLVPQPYRVKAVTPKIPQLPPRMRYTFLDEAS